MVVAYFSCFWSKNPQRAFKTLNRLLLTGLLKILQTPSCGHTAASPSPAVQSPAQIVHVRDWPPRAVSGSSAASGPGSAGSGFTMVSFMIIMIQPTNQQNIFSTTCSSKATAQKVTWLGWRWALFIYCHSLCIGRPATRTLARTSVLELDSGGQQKHVDHMGGTGENHQASQHKPLQMHPAERRNQACWASCFHS